MLAVWGRLDLLDRPWARQSGSALARNAAGPFALPMLGTLRGLQFQAASTKLLDSMACDSGGGNTSVCFPDSTACRDDDRARALPPESSQSPL